MSLGSKNPKKEINIELTKGKIFLGFIGLMFLTFIIIKIMIFLGFGTIEGIKISCNNVTIEEIVFGKEYYCDEHYSKLKDNINENQYKYIEDVIFNRSNEVDING